MSKQLTHSEALHEVMELSTDDEIAQLAEQFYTSIDFCNQLMANPHVGKNSLYWVTKNVGEDSHLDSQISKHPLISDYILIELSKQYYDYRPGTHDETTYQNLIAHKNLPGEALDFLSQNTQKQTVHKIFQSDRAFPQTLRNIYFSRYSTQYEELLLVENPNTPVDVLIAISEHKPNSAKEILENRGYLQDEKGQWYNILDEEGEIK